MPQSKHGVTMRRHVERQTRAKALADAREHAQNLIQWLSSGGFFPTALKDASALRAFDEWCVDYLQNEIVGATDDDQTSGYG